MKILLHGINFAPELTGIGKYTGEMAVWLAARGHQVRVVTAPPYYPDWKVGAGFRNWWGTEVMDCHVAVAPRNDDSGAVAPRNDDESNSSLRAQRGNPVEPGSHGLLRRCAPRNDDTGSLVVYRCPLWVPAKPGGAKRLLHLASFALSSLPVMLRQILWRPDVVWVVAPALFCAPTASLVARLSGAKAWLHVQDFEVDAAFDLGLLKGQRVKGVVLAAERWLLRRFDVVSTISNRMVERLQAKGVPPARTVLFANWVDIAAITPSRHCEERSDAAIHEVQHHGLPRFARNDEDRGHGLPRFARNDVDKTPNHFRTLLGIAPDAVVALYSGNMGGKQGLELLADVARLCQSYEQNSSLALTGKAQAAIIFVFCGNGAGRADLVQRCAGLSHVHFLDLQPMALLNDLLAMADIHLLPQRADAADLVMPSKLTGMLASGRAVLATAHAGTELAAVVQQCGVVVPPEDAQAFATALQALASQPQQRAALGAAGRKFAQDHLDREAVLGRFEADLRGVVAMR